ncbi:tetraacyldisaccharide 4'-kinase [Simplicispira suum]|uniref:Tetraacyldisaccharide 4'-kinase n=1 Tax=Simplicispira suum TaxID=2109915 RepID=A0A2S0N2Z9_9BURK|nr:tetraacyldisaccharide 4'-kinase [Simplicispira suum]AVO42522.1 tetraacyldisaccharide 4'-kinase [Simplicispira suum]
MPQPADQAWPQSSWRGRGATARLLWPLSFFYGALVRLRQRLYRLGWLRSSRFAVPVIVVGNVVAGGAGKTPVVMALVQHLQARGRRPGVVSRGYGRSSQGTRFAERGSAAQEVGDEPALIARRCRAPVVVSEQRSDAAEALLAQHPDTDVIVCDDGLQHLALARDLEICVFGAQGVGNGWLLPAGPLREPWPRPVDWVLYAGSPPPDCAAACFEIVRSLAHSARTANGDAVALSDLAEIPLVAVAGIAQPEDFFALLRSRGLVLAQALALPDHFDFDSWKPNIDKRQRLICTEKDAVKLWPRFPEALAVPLEVSIDPAFFAALDVRLDQLQRASLSSPS